MFDKKVYDAEYRRTHKKERAEYRAAHKDEIAKRTADYSKAHGEDLSQYAAKWRKEHRKERAKCGAEYREAHRGERKIYAAGYYKSHKTERAQYLQEHRVERAAYNAKRRALKAGTLVNATPGQLAEIKEIYRKAQEDDKVRCYLCGELIPMGHRHVDHILPLSKGGTSLPSNLAVACDKCNLSKQAKLPEEIGLLI